MSGSTPTLTEFNPTHIPFQYQVIQDIFCNFDYSSGVHELLLSGSVGSSKSILMAHIGVVHCLQNPGAKCLLARKAMPDLKDTIFRKILDHLEGSLVLDQDYFVTEQNARIEFINGSEILSRSWADKRYRKFRSLELSCALIEELTENSSEEFESFYKELIARVGRLPHIKQNFVIAATNPDAPSHLAYEYFIANKDKNRHVYYSVTRDNPFLPKSYIDRLEKTYTKQEARRMLHGEWLEIKSEVIYYAFSDKNIIKNYKVDMRYPIIIAWDFNIGMGKPMSCCLLQYKEEKFYVFDEVVISGANTLESCEEQQLRGLWDHPTNYLIMGDAAGKSKSTKYNKSDYDIILSAMKSHLTPHGRMNVELDVPSSNPPVRRRHILVNGQLCNASGEIRLFVSEKCETMIKGLRLTRLKKGGAYIEDDSPSCPYQHITTALGYAIVRVIDNNESENNAYIGDFYGNSTSERERYSQPRISKDGHRGYRG